MSLNNKSREELFTIWKKRINIAKDFHKENVINWADRVFLDFSGENASNLDTGERYSQVCEIIQSIEQTIQPHLFFRNPTFNATAKRPEWDKRVALVSAVVNQEYTDIKKTGNRLELENELCVLDARLLPFGATETTWRVKGGLVQEEQDQSTLDKLGGFITGKKPKPIFKPVIEEEVGHITDRMNPLKLLLDYSAPHITKQKFTIKIMHGKKEDLMTPRYDYELVADLKDDTVLIPDYKNSLSVDKDKYQNDPDFRGLTWYEIHDLENRVIHTIVDGVGDFIEFNAPYPIPEGSVFSYLWFVTTPNRVYPVPPIKFYRRTAKEFSYVHSQVSEQINKFLPKIGFDVNRLSKPDQDRWKVGNLGALVGFNGSPQGAWDVLQPKVQDDMFKYLAMKKDLLNLEAGVNDYEVSIPEKRNELAVQEVAGGTKARRYGPQRRVKAFLINQAHTIWQILAENATEDQFVKVLGTNDTMEWWNDPETGKASWTKENIAGDYSWDFDVEQLSPLSEGERKQQNAENLKVITAPEIDQALLAKGYEFNIVPFIDKFATENMGIKDKSKYITKLDGLEPGDEHTLWMQGQFPQISQRELADTKFMVKHFQAHQMFNNSPAFSFLPHDIQQGAIQHTDTYLPHFAQLQQQQMKQKQSKSQPQGQMA